MSQFIFTLSLEQQFKFWSKREISEISEFSILGIGQNWKLKNLGNFLFFSKLYWNFSVFLSVHFYFFFVVFFGVFKSWIAISVKIRGKRNFRDFRAFDLGYRAKSKTWKSRKFLFFLLRIILEPFSFSLSSCFCCF